LTSIAQAAQFEGVFMPEKETIDYELNQDFLNEVRESLGRDEATRNILTAHREEDMSLYISVEEEPYLLSFSN
jgi:hypothetical protein